MLKPLERDLEEFVDNWNTHLIRHNRLSGCPSGIPNHLYDYPSVYGNFYLLSETIALINFYTTVLLLCTKCVGTQDYSKNFDVNIWLRAMVSESQSSPPFYSNEFKEWADFILREELGMTQEDITQTSCRGVYLYLATN